MINPMIANAKKTPTVIAAISALLRFVGFNLILFFSSIKKQTILLSIEKTSFRFFPTSNENNLCCRITNKTNDFHLIVKTIKSTFILRQMNNNPPPLSKKLYLTNLSTSDDRIILPRFGLLTKTNKVEKNTEDYETLLRCKAALKHMPQSPTKETSISNDSPIIAMDDK